MSEKDIALFQHEDFLELRDSILLDIPHGVQLTTDEVIAHLHGLQNLVKRVPLALEIILRESNIKISGIKLENVYVEQLKQGSWVDDIRSAFKFLGNREEVENAKKLIMDNKVLFGMLIAGTVSYFAFKSFSPVGMTNAENGLQIQQIIGVNTITVTPDALEKGLRKTVAHSEADGIKSTIDFTAPAKHRNAGIRFFSSTPGAFVDVPHSQIEKVPDIYIPPTRQEQVDCLDDVEIQFRALDVDKTESGWGAIIPAVHPTKRLPLKISEEVDRNVLLSSPTIRGTIEVTYRFSKGYVTTNS